MAQQISAAAATAVYGVWSTPEDNPRTHARAKNELRASWPALGKALDDLVTGVTVRSTQKRSPAPVDKDDPFQKRAQAKALRDFAKSLRASTNGSVGMAPVARLTALNVATDLDRQALIYEKQLKDSARR